MNHLSDSQQPIQPLALLRLQQLISPALPIGAFTYSQGMEYAHQAGWLSDKNTVFDWLTDLIKHHLQHFELPILFHLRQSIAQNDINEMTHLCALNIAGRETAELRLEEQQRGQALFNILSKLANSEESQHWQTHKTLLRGNFLGGFALGTHLWHIPIETTLLGYAFGFLENMISVSVKLIPLGQSDGQTLLYQLSATLPDIVQAAQHIHIEDIGSSLPAMAIASSRHASQYCRLFRS